MLARRALVVAVAAGALLLASCGGDDQQRGADRTTRPTIATTEVRTTEMKDHATTTAATTPMETHFTVTAKNVAFTPTKLSAPVGQELEIVFDNEDSGVAHNLHFKVPSDEKTDVKQGTVQDTLKFTVKKAGKYDYVCDVHPTMKGTLTVS